MYSDVHLKYPFVSS